MDDVAASVGFAGWAFAAMCDHALCVPGMGIESSDANITKMYRTMNLGSESLPRAWAAGV